RLRFKVLARDKFKCVLCGSSPATDPSCILHVDHMIPWSKGGQTVIQNLQTLCVACNLRKGDQSEKECRGQEENQREPPAKSITFGRGRAWQLMRTACAQRVAAQASGLRSFGRCLCLDACQALRRSSRKRAREPFQLCRI